MNKTLKETYNSLLDSLKEQNIPEIELRMLLCEVNGIEDMSSFYLRNDEPVKDEELFQSYLARLLSGEPVQYIINKAYFYGSTFYVDQNVLIPRMETEELVQAALKEIKSHYPNPKVIDIGTGSGCIIISLAKNAFGTYTGVEISRPAIEIAKKNAELLKANIIFYESDLFQETIKRKERYDIIIGNPPYIINKKEIDKRTIEYEPKNALYPDKDVYEFYKDLLIQSRLVLNENGMIMLEIGYDMKDKLEAIAKEVYPNKNVEFIKDINNKYRIIKIR